MRKVLFYCLLLILGMIASQFLPEGGGKGVVSLLTMFALSFIMIHVGYEFDVDKSRLGQYVKDYLVAARAASLPWLFCAGYFVFVMQPRARWSDGDAWCAALLEGLFAAPTSAGVLFSMLSAAGLAATWVFAKARVLAIADDLHTILLLIPLQAMLIGFRWQLAATAVLIVVILLVAYRYLKSVSLPVTWPWTFGYSAGIIVLCEAVYVISKRFDPAMPLHLEVLLPAFALGCVLKNPPGQDPHSDDAREGVEPGPESRREQEVSTLVSACFMVLVGLSMPPIGAAARGHAGVIGLHVLAIILLSNLGKMVPAFCYRREASLEERLALAVGMFPRGEVGAGVLVIALRYGMAGAATTVAILSLALNLVCTGLFILVVKKLLTLNARSASPPPAPCALP